MIFTAAYFPLCGKMNLIENLMDGLKEIESQLWELQKKYYYVVKDHAIDLYTQRCNELKKIYSNNPVKTDKECKINLSRKYKKIYNELVLKFHPDKSETTRTIFEYIQKIYKNGDFKILDDIYSRKETITDTELHLHVDNDIMNFFKSKAFIYYQTRSDDVFYGLYTAEEFIEKFGTDVYDVYFSKDVKDFYQDIRSIDPIVDQAFNLLENNLLSI